jgi:hypothetical protein
MASVRKRSWTTSSGETKTAWCCDYTDVHGDRQRKTFRNKKSADAFRITIEGQMQAGTYRASADKITIKMACESFLSYCEGRHQRDERMTRKMLAVYRGHINNHILKANHAIGSRKLSQFTARSWVISDHTRASGVSVPTARRYWRRCTPSFSAPSPGWIATNAAQIRGCYEGRQEIIPPSKDAMRALIDAADDDLRIMLVLLPLLARARASNGPPDGLTSLSTRKK